MANIQKFSKIYTDWMMGTQRHLSLKTAIWDIILCLIPVLAFQGSTFLLRKRDFSSKRSNNQTSILSSSPSQPCLLTDKKMTPPHTHTNLLEFPSLLLWGQQILGGREWKGSLLRTLVGRSYETPPALCEELQVEASCPVLRGRINQTNFI